MTTETTPTPRVTIEHSGDGTTATFDKDDLDARAAVKAAGFRWSGNQRLWFLNSRWSEPTRRLRVRRVVTALGADHVEVLDGGRAPSTTAAEREQIAQEKAAARADRLDARADRLSGESDAEWEKGRKIGEHIPFGQP